MKQHGKWQVLHMMVPNLHVIAPTAALPTGPGFLTENGEGPWKNLTPLYWIQTGLGIVQMAHLGQK